ncbi:MAG: NAD(P)/FAD-dependent oxidoreductase [Vicinamibacterales bacterium]
MRGLLVIVGAGAAGLMAAASAAEAGAPVLVVETTRDGGRKILISGGGRCNILPAALEPERFVTDSPARILRGLLRSWPLEQQKAFFEDEVGLPLAFESESRKYFPRSNRARDVRDGLVALCRRRGVEFRFGTTVTGLDADGDAWRVDTDAGPLEAAAVVLASGGLSVPATGSDGRGLELASALGHRVHPAYPALTPLVASPARHVALSGVSLEVRLRSKWEGRNIETRGGFLFTHHGYSGPAVLDISHVAVRSRLAGAPATIRAQWSPLGPEAWHDELTAGTGLVSSSVGRHLPQRLAVALVDEAGIPPDRRVSDLRRAERTALVERLTSYPLPWTGDEGYRKAEVTGGGVALDEVDAATLESRHRRGLFLCGELLDAFGPIGGHNFAWAWTTGRRAGRGAAARVQPTGRLLH